MKDTSTPSTATTSEVSTQPGTLLANNVREEDLIIESLRHAAPSLAVLLGENCEVVVHDLRRPEASIVALENGHVSNRRLGGPLIGGPINDVALGWVSGSRPPTSKVLSYDTLTSEGRKLKSTTTLYYNQAGRAYAALCLNFDLSGAYAASRWLEAIVKPASPETGEHNPEPEPADFNDVLDRLIAECIAEEPVPTKGYTRDTRFRIVRALEARGAFLMRGAVVKVAVALGVSKFTVYGYLDEIRNE